MRVIRTGSRSSFLALLALALLASCRGVLPPVQPSQVDPLSPTATSTPPLPAPIPIQTSSALNASPAPSPTPATLPAPQYILSASYDYNQHALSAQEQIIYANRSQESIPELLLVVDALVFPGTFALTSLKSAAGPAVSGTTLEKTWLHAALDRPLAPGETIQLDLAYTLNLPARTADPSLRPMVFGWSERQTNLVDWYPYLPPYQAGKGWQAHPPGFYGEHQVYEASDFNVNLQVVNAPEGLAAAASAPETLEGGWRHYALKNARTFAISLGPLYKTSTRTAGAVTVTGYFFPADKAAGERAVQTAAEALELYSRLYAPLDIKSLAVVEADFQDGMEYSGLFFLSEGFYNLYNGAPGEYLVSIAAHETAHQWWYGLVGSDQAEEPWLDEALCTYSEELFYENAYPAGQSWWWEARVKYYQPRGWVDDSIYNPHHEAQAYRAYRDAVYLNGAIFLDDLRKLVGDETFFAFLKDYAAQNRYAVTSAEQFFTLLRRHTSADLAPLLKRYFAQAH